jgi:hypothetical protein
MSYRIESIRNQTVQKRRRTTLVVSTGLTGLIAIIWLVTLPGRITQATNRIAVDEVRTAGPVEVFISSVKNSAGFAWSQRSRASAIEILNLERSEPSTEEFLDSDSNNDFNAKTNVITDQSPEFIPMSNYDFLP